MGKNAVLELSLYFNVPGRHFCQMKTLIVAVLSIPANLRDIGFLLHVISLTLTLFSTILGMDFMFTSKMHNDKTFYFMS